MTWQAELIGRYPLLFRADEPETARGYPAVGDGWQLIVEKAIARIDTAVGGLLNDPKTTVHIKQIKEKLGGLRIYVEWTGLPPQLGEAIEEAIDLAEARASWTCEVCGAAGRLYDRRGWYVTRCGRHAEGERVPARHGEADDLHLQFTLLDGKMRVTRCRRYDRERDAFLDAPLPPGEQWAEKT